MTRAITVFVRLLAAILGRLLTEHNVSSGPRYYLGTRSRFDPACHGRVVFRAHAGYPVLPPAVPTRIAFVRLGRAIPLTLLEVMLLKPVLCSTWSSCTKIV